MNIKHIITKTAYVLAIVAISAPVSTFAASKTSTYYSSSGIGGGSSYYSYTPVSTYSSRPSSSSYYSYTPVSTYSSRPTYSYTPSASYSAPAYTYTPSAAYSYVPLSGGTTGGGYQYVYSSNSNSNTNTNTNTVTNTFNPVNNNDAKINLIVYGGGTTGNPSTPTESMLDGNCFINPTVANINQDLSFNASASGGNGSYSYSWTGTDGLFSNAQSFTGRFANPGFKTATVTIRSGSQVITRTCSVNVNGVLATQSNVTVLRDNNLGTPVSGVFLSQVPATGIGFGLKMTLFTLGLALWSIFAAYMIARRNTAVSLPTYSTSTDKATAFKQANYFRKIQG